MTRPLRGAKLRRHPIVKRVTLSLCTISLAMIGACSASKDEAQDNQFSADPDRAKIEKIVRAYILEHPELITEAVQVLQERETARMIDANRRAIEMPFAGAWAGAKDGDVVLVEFFDYACGYCRASNPDIARLLAEDKNLKVVWRELPVLGDDSVAAARVSLAAAKQGKFAQFHDALFAAGPPSAATIAKAQKEAGVTPQQSNEFDVELQTNYELSKAMNANGTPAFVVGNKVLHGAVGYDALKDAIAEARKKA